MKIYSDITTVQEAKTFIDHLYNIKSATSDAKLISLIDDYLARIEDEDVTVGELQSLLVDIIHLSDHSKGKNMKLDDLGIVNITLAEFKKHVADAQNESIDFQLECGSSHIQSQCKVGFLSVEKFQQFLDKNPDFHNEDDSGFYNWDIIDPKLQGLDVYPCYISDLNLFGYYSK